MVRPLESIKRLLTHFDRAYLLVGAVAGLLYLVITPPFQVPDEPHHFFRAYQVSTGRMISERQEDKWGGRIPRSLIYAVEDTGGDEVASHPEKKVSISAIREALGHPLREQKGTFAHFPNTALYSPVPYLPSAFAILIGRVLNAPPLVLLYLGRLANLITAVLICAYAVRMAPVYSRVLFLIVCTPMFIFEAASLSSDAVTDSLAILFIACILKSAFGSEGLIGNRDMILLAALAAGLGLCKSIYWILALLFFVIPRERFSSKRRYYAAGIGLCLLAILVSYGWLLIVKPLYVPYMGMPTLDQPRDFILSHPFVFSKMLIKDLAGHFVFYAGSFVGYLGWEDTPIPSVLVVLYLSVLTAVGMLAWDKRVRRQDKIIFALTACLGAVLVVTSQFLIATVPDSPVISKSQGRYFIPIVPLVFFLFSNKRLTMRLSSEKALRVVAVGLPIFAGCFLLLGVMVLIRRFYL